MRFRWASIFLTFMISLNPLDEANVGGAALESEQRDRLRNTQVILLKALSLTEKGLVDPKPLFQVVSERLREMGYTVIQTVSKPHDVTLKVKCEERKTGVGITKFGGDAGRPGSPSRLWKGPACQLTYWIDSHPGPWRHEVRTDFEEAWTAAEHTHAHNSGAFALSHLYTKLEESDFHLALAAEWEQSDRLANILISPQTDRATRLKIMSLAGHLSGPSMLEAIQQTMTDPRLTTEAILALGRQGERATPILMNLVKTSQSVEAKATAVQALGEIGAQNGGAQIIPHLLTMVQTPDLDLKVQTEVVKALGKMPDQRSVEPLEKLGLQAWTTRSNDPQLQKLREAVDWSLWQITPSAHTEE